MNIRNHVYPFIFFIDNSSHICHAAPMVNFNFLAQLIIITILYSFRYSQQDKSPNSTWCRSLPSRKTKKRIIECLIVVCLKENSMWTRKHEKQLRSLLKPDPTFFPFSKFFAICFPFKTSLVTDQGSNTSCRWAIRYSNWNQGTPCPQLKYLKVFKWISELESTTFAKLAALLNFLLSWCLKACFRFPVLTVIKVIITNSLNVLS